MPVTRRFVLVMAALAGIAACTLFGKDPEGVHGSSFDFVSALRSNVKKTIADPDKADSLLRAIDAMEEALLDLDRAARHYYEKLDALDADYNSSQEDLEQLTAEFNAERIGLRSRILDSRFRMRDKTGDPTISQSTP